jgi:Protein of unknown function (DUF3617)
MKLTTVAVLVTLGLAAAASDAAAQSSPMRPGRWEVTIQMEMPGMPMQMPPIKDARCITQQQLDSPARGLPSGAKNPNDCKVSNYMASGSTVTWSMACSGPPASTGTGELRFDGDTYNGTMKMTMEQMPMTMKLSGKRVGDCTQ